MASNAQVAIHLLAIDKASAEVRKVARELNKVEGAARSASKQAAAAAGPVRQLDQALGAMGLSSTSAGASIGQLDASIGALGVTAGVTVVAIGALAAGVGYSLKTAVDFEASFARIRKTVEGSEEEFRALAAANRQLARDLGINVNEINRIGEIGGQLGIAARDIDDFARTVAQLNITTQVSVDELAASLGRLTTIMDVPVSELDRLGSALTALGNQFNSTEGAILDLATRIAGAAKVVGISAADVLGIANAFASLSGPEVEAAGTAIQKILFELQKAAVGTSEEAQASAAVFAALTNQSVESFRAMMRENPTQVFVQVLEGLGAVGDQAIVVLEALGLADARVARNALAAALAKGELQRSIDVANQAALENIATEAEVEKQLDTTSAQWNRLKANVNDVAISIGLALNPVVRELLRGLNESIDGIRNFADWLKNADQHTKALAAGIAGVATPFGFIGGAIAVLAVNWRDAWNAMADVMEPVINGVIKFVVGVVNVVGGIVQALGRLVGGWGNAWDKVTGIIQSAADVIEGVLQGIVSAISAAADFLDGIIGKINDVAGGLGGVLSKIGIELPELPTIGLEAPTISIPRAGGGGGGAQNFGDIAGGIQSVASAMAEMNRQAAAAAQATNDVTIDIQALLAALARLTGSGGGGGGAGSGGGGAAPIPRAVNELEVLAGALAASGMGAVEFKARLELAAEQQAAVAEAERILAESRERAAIDLTKLAIVLGEAGISGEAFVAQQALLALGRNIAEAGVDMQSFGSIVVANIQRMGDASVEFLRALQATMERLTALAAQRDAQFAIAFENYDIRDASGNVVGRVSATGIARNEAALRRMYEQIVRTAEAFGGLAPSFEEFMRSVMDVDKRELERSRQAYETIGKLAGSSADEAYEAMKKWRLAGDEARAWRQQMMAMYASIREIQAIQRPLQEAEERRIREHQRQSGAAASGGVRIYGPVTVNAQGSVDEALREMEYGMRSR